MTNLLKNGSKGDAVKALQTKLVQLGFELEADGHFGPMTEKNVRELQRVFGYTIDGIVGEGTQKLIDAQIGYGWNAKSPDAEERGLRAQGKNAEADALKAKLAGAGAKVASGPAPVTNKK
ncbi:MAG: peptidoglycan-binding protein [Sandaracinaceae bacterium]|jgi:peptidoglycan hydrolase-like protein with peptidoglycan-binding domain|nr:peptidoglycan-binding protein [Sandaracinaceae bacterium]